MMARAKKQKHSSIVTNLLREAVRVISSSERSPKFAASALFKSRHSQRES